MEPILAGVSMILQWDALLLIAVGVFSGILVGAIPGIGPVQLIAISLPWTFTLPPIPALMLLMAQYAGGVYGGSIPAVLIRTPGDVGSVATVLDGYALSQQGRSRQALTLILYCSVIGGLFGTGFLFLTASHMARLALKFGPMEMFAVILFALTIIVVVAGNSLAKGIIAAALGALFASVGQDPITGTGRYIFGIAELQRGFGLIPLMIGLFAFSEILILLERILRRGHDLKQSGPLTLAVSDSQDRLTLAQFLKLKFVILRSAIVGSVVGAIPGLGASAASFAAYGIAESSSKEPHRFGKGSLEGIAASETANNSTTSSALIPLLALGIPGSGIVAMLIGAFQIHGLSPGPLLFRYELPTVYGLYFGLFFTQVLLLVMGKYGLPLFVRVIRIPIALLLPPIAVLTITGTFSVYNSYFDVAVMFLFGVFGYLMRKVEIPEAPLVVAFILTPMFEGSLRQALILTKGNLLAVLSSPIAAVFIVLAVVFTGFTLYRRWT